MAYNSIIYDPPLPAVKVYTDFLPTQSFVGVPDTSKKSITIGEGITERVFYNNSSVRLYKHYYSDGHDELLVDSANEYAEGLTISTGDIVKVSSIGLKFRYAGLDTFTVSSANINDKHPLNKDANDNFINQPATWVSYGVIDELKPFDGSNNSILKVGSEGVVSNSSAYTLKIQFEIIGEFSDDSYLCLFGLKAFNGVSVKISPKTHSTKYSYGGYDVNGNPDPHGEYDENGNHVGTLQETGVFLEPAFTKSFPNSDRLCFKLQTYYIGLTSPTSQRIEIIFNNSYQTGPIINYLKSEIASISVVNSKHNITSPVNYLGSPLYGHSQNRVSEFKTVISDGVEKSMVIKSYDVWSGDILVDASNLQKVEHTLATATQGDYVFHTGTGQEIYDQRVYLGHIKYNSPINNPSGKYKIHLSGQSLAYGVENHLIASDSTDGYAQ